MNERDKRAVENMALCGISLEGLLGAFPKFPAEEVMEIYNKVNGNITLASPIEFKINCS